MLSLLVLLHLRVVAAQVVDCEAEASCAGMAPCCMVRLGPEDQTPEAYAAWRPGFEAWRTRVRAALESSAPRGFAAYDAPAVEWSRSDWVQAKTMLHDRYLFDRGTNQWTVQRYLDDLVDRYGGVDSVVPAPVITSSASLTHKRPLCLSISRVLSLTRRARSGRTRARVNALNVLGRNQVLWQFYPNAGVDDRNQFDMIASLPGGMNGARQLVSDFEAAGVK